MTPTSFPLRHDLWPAAANVDQAKHLVARLDSRIARYGPGSPETQTSVLRDKLSPTLESLAVLAIRKKSRCIGFTGGHRGAGVGMVSRLLAQVFVDSGFNALHIDLSDRLITGVDSSCWQSPKDDPASCVKQQPGEAAMLVARPTSGTRAHFNDDDQIAERFQTLMDGFQPLIVELAPLTERSQATINPVAAAAACDALIFVCSRAQTRRRQIEEAVDLCRANELKLAGVIMNGAMR